MRNQNSNSRTNDIMFYLSLIAVLLLFASLFSFKSYMTMRCIGTGIFTFIAARSIFFQLIGKVFIDGIARVLPFMRYAKYIVNAGLWINTALFIFWGSWFARCLLILAEANPSVISLVSWIGMLAVPLFCVLIFAMASLRVTAKGTNRAIDFLEGGVEDADAEEIE